MLIYESAFDTTNRGRLTEAPSKVPTAHTTLRTIDEPIIHMWERRIEPVKYPDM